MEIAKRIRSSSRIYRRKEEQKKLYMPQLRSYNCTRERERHKKKEVDFIGSRRVHTYYK